MAKVTPAIQVEGVTKVYAEGTEAEKRVAFANAYRMLQRRIDVFTSLPVNSLARLAIQKKIEEIGMMVDTPEKAS